MAAIRYSFLHLLRMFCKARHLPGLVIEQSTDVFDPCE